MKCSRRPWYSKKKSESHRAMEKPENLQTSNCSRLQQVHGWCGPNSCYSQSIVFTSWRDTKFPTMVKAKERETCYCLSKRTTPTSRNKAAKRQRQNMPPEDCLANVGPHLPIKGEEDSHWCVVRKEIHKGQEKWGNFQEAEDQLNKYRQYNVYLCIGLPNESCFVNHHTKTDYWKWTWRLLIQFFFLS